MLNIISLIVGIIILIGTLISSLSSRSNTLRNLRGFYGDFYASISVFGLLGGIGLIILSFLI